MSFDQPAFPIERVRLFSADGLVYRAFWHLVAARVGSLLCVPFHLVTGRCDAVQDYCPVPWEEVFAVLDEPFSGPCDHGLAHVVEAMEKVRQLDYMGIDPLQCDLDFIRPMENGTSKVMRMVHPCGVRYAVVM